ncbi:MAG: prepilin-type N-terminal cleavage/methylation domain-containing protein, partial [Candidatus Avelusimicrobium sp.]
MRFFIKLNNEERLAVYICNCRTPKNAFIVFGDDFVRPVLSQRYRNAEKATSRILFLHGNNTEEGRMRKNEKKAFTLTELLVVVIVIGVLS